MSTLSTSLTAPIFAVPVPGVPATFSLEHYEHMIECGAFAGEYEKNIELLWGRIVEMPPIGPSHSNDVDVLNDWSMRVTLDEAIRVRIQNPVRLPESHSEPHPDVCWVRKKDYSRQHPGPSDILLLMEVSDSSLKEDRTAKLAAYAHAGIQDYWIVNLVDIQIEVYRQPSGMEYKEKLIFRGEEAVSPLALPTATITANELLAKSA